MASACQTWHSWTSRTSFRFFVHFYIAHDFILNKNFYSNVFVSNEWIKWTSSEHTSACVESESYALWTNLEICQIQHLNKNVRLGNVKILKPYDWMYLQRMNWVDYPVVSVSPAMVILLVCSSISNRIRWLFEYSLWLYRRIDSIYYLFRGIIPSVLTIRIIVLA